MSEGLGEPLARVQIAHPGDDIDAGVLADWGDVQRTLCAWTAKGCALMARGGAVLDIVTLATVSPQDLGGTELLIFHSHVATHFPWLVRPVWEEH